MGEKSNQIERQIAIERGQLWRNLNELQSRVEDATDWRLQFQKRPLVMMGAAAGGGLLLAAKTIRPQVARFAAWDPSCPLSSCPPASCEI